MNDREAMKLALEALESASNNEGNFHDYKHAAAALRQALEQPEQEKNMNDTPAFPQERTLPCGSHEECEGLSMLDYFAAKAMQTLCHFSKFSVKEIVGLSYEIAAAMMKERVKWLS